MKMLTQKLSEQSPTLFPGLRSGAYEFKMAERANFFSWSEQHISRLEKDLDKGFSQ